MIYYSTQNKIHNFRSRKIDMSCMIHNKLIILENIEPKHVALYPLSKYPLLHKHVFGDEAFKVLLYAAEHNLHPELPLELHTWQE